MKKISSIRPLFGLTALLASCTHPAPPDLSTARGRMEAVCGPSVIKSSEPLTIERLTAQSNCERTHLDLLDAVVDEIHNDPTRTHLTMEQTQAKWDRESAQAADDHVAVYLWKHGY